MDYFLFHIAVNMKMDLVGMIFMVLFLTAKGNNDTNDVAEMKAKMDAMEKRQEAMEKRLSKMNAMEERLETLERQTCKDIFKVNKGKRKIHSFINFQLFFQIPAVFNGRWRIARAKFAYEEVNIFANTEIWPVSISCSFWEHLTRSYVVALSNVESWIRPDVYWCRTNNEF